MTLLPLEFTVPTLDIARAFPCGAYVEALEAECGATPALLFRRVCVHAHARDVWLCQPHEAVISRLAVCRDCANLGDRSHRCAVALVKVPEVLDLIRAGQSPLSG